MTVNRCMYGLIQATWQYYKKALEIFKKLGFIGGNVDPCLHVKKSEKGVACVALYIVDNLMVGDIEAIDEAIADIKKN